MPAPSSRLWKIVAFILAMFATPGLTRAPGREAEREGKGPSRRQGNLGRQDHLRQESRHRRHRRGRQTAAVGQHRRDGHESARQKDGKIKVLTHQGIEAWFDKNEAVLKEKAVDYFTEIIKNNPNDANGYYCRAVAYRLTGDLDQAIKDSGEVIKLDPRAHAYNSRGNIYYVKKNYDEAIKDYSEAIKLDAKYPMAFINRGMAYSTKKDYELAIKDYSEAIKLDDKYARVFYDPLAQQALKNYGDAIKDYSEAIKLSPKSRRTSTTAARPITPRRNSNSPSKITTWP